jgi:anti-sigma B factor antagonist
MMQVTTRNIGNSAILELNGRLVIGMDILDLREGVRAAICQNRSKIILNLAKVSYADSCGVGELVRTLTHLKKIGVGLVLMDLPPKVRILLETAQLIPAFEISESNKAEITTCTQQVSLPQLCS